MSGKCIGNLKVDIDTCDSPSCEFSISNRIRKINEQITCTAISSILTNHSWLLDGTTISTNQNAITLTFDTPGIYKLTHRGMCGSNSCNTTQNIYITEYPIMGLRGTTGAVVPQNSKHMWFFNQTYEIIEFGDEYTIPLIGDWDGDGSESMAVYDPTTSLFTLKNNRYDSIENYTISFGIPGDIPISWYDPSSKHDRFGVIRGNDVYLARSIIQPYNNMITTTIDKMTCYNPYIRQCLYKP